VGGYGPRRAGEVGVHEQLARVGHLPGLRHGRHGNLLVEAAVPALRGTRSLPVVLADPGPDK